MLIDTNLALKLIFALTLLTFLLFGFDKLMATNGGRRVPEKTLLLLCVTGGWLGGLAGMLLFRHKVSKTEFKIAFVGTILANVAVSYLIFFPLQ